MSKKTSYALDATEREQCSEAADLLSVAFSWDSVPFPDLTDIHDSRHQWLALYNHLKNLSKKG